MREWKWDKAPNVSAAHEARDSVKPQRLELLLSCSKAVELNERERSYGVWRVS